MNIDFKKLSNSEGYKKLKSTAIKECLTPYWRSNKRGYIPTRCKPSCFNVNGCTKDKKEEDKCTCWSRPCNTFRWVIDRVRHYSEKLGIPPEDILDAWEQQRTYSFVNYYQNCNQPKLKECNKVIIVDTNEDAKKFIENNTFICPACKGETKDPIECSSGKTKGPRKCNWKAYGLFGTGVYLVIKKPLSIRQIFPVKE